MQVKVRLPYPPSVNNYWGRSRFGRVYLKKQAKEYKEKVQELVSGYKPFTGPLGIQVAVYRPRKVGDLDNTLKAILDSLKGLLYVDDKQIELILAKRFDDKVNPRTEVTVYELQ